MVLYDHKMPRLLIHAATGESSRLNNSEYCFVIHWFFLKFPNSERRSNGFINFHCFSPIQTPLSGTLLPMDATRGKAYLITLIHPKVHSPLKFKVSFF
jgi:hypothetical protein